MKPHAFWWKLPPALERRGHPAPLPHPGGPCRVISWGVGKLPGWGHWRQKGLSLWVSWVPASTAFTLSKEWPGDDFTYSFLYSTNTPRAPHPTVMMETVW